MFLIAKNSVEPICEQYDITFFISRVYKYAQMWKETMPMIFYIDSKLNFSNSLIFSPLGVKI